VALGSLAVSEGTLNPFLLVLVAALAAVVGDSLTFLLGSRLGAPLRARVRRLVQRGRALVDGGYRELAGLDQLASPPLGRNSPTSDRP